ncbi:MAG: carbohydrate ABC transporter substrate-binding protein [Solirubrobacteraceae bacterium]|nr:carbohydrate ABC transporter substrate-binding protein [Solirubrobacteraceae bacterium]
MSTHRRTLTTAIAVVGMAAALVAGCGDDDDSGDSASQSGTSTAAAGSDSVKGNVAVVGVWTGDEQKSFQAVLDAFEERYPNVKVKYTAGGDNTPTVLSTAVEGGNPPDVAAVAQPGLVKDFQRKKALKPIGFARATLVQQYPDDIVKLGTIQKDIYSYVFKAANKSTVWFNVPTFETAGVQPPKDWDGFLENAKTIQASGTPAYSIGGADGWTLTDLFENIYLRQAGPEKYDQLTTHDIPWTDPSVKQALTTMGDVLGDTKNIKGGTSGALETEFPSSVEAVFSDPAKAAQVIEGDFVPGVVAEQNKLEPKTGYDVFPFPAINDSTNAVVGGGDSIIMFKDTPASQALVGFLATKEAHEVWAKRGGFSSANKDVDPSVYPDDITRTTATAIAKADPFRFDMSDLAPVDFGGTPGQGEWKILQDFLENPDDVDGTASKLEASAKKAYGAQ